MVAIIDYGMGNLHSIHNMIKNIGEESIISNLPSEIELCDKIILPGVGAFDRAVNQLHQLQLWDFLNDQALIQKKPILGICLGMQLISKKSEEGNLNGFGWIEATTKKFTFDKNFLIPHMGWNSVIFNPNHSSQFPETQNLDTKKFYFVHSYFVECENKENILCSTKYGNEFTSGIIKDNIYGLQFHPEKSHFYGKHIFKDFINS